MKLPTLENVHGAAAFVGARVRQAREEAGLSQGALARAIDVARPTVSYWEAGDRMPGVDDLLRLSVVLRRPPEYFLPQPAAAEPAPAAAIFRAEASRLAGIDLGPEVDQLVKRAAQMKRPRVRFRPRGRQPEEVANELLTVARASRPPVDVHRLSEFCGARVVERRFSSDALSGFLIFLPDGAVVGANARHAPVRRRFTIAHELGHLLLGHHAEFHLDLDSPVASGDPPGYDWRSERAANTFAASLLMPQHLLRADVERTGIDVAHLSSRYAVSQEAMAIRLAVLRLT